MSFINKIFGINQKSYDEMLEEVANEEAITKRFSESDIINDLQDDIIKANALSYDFNPREAQQSSSFAGDGTGRGYFFADSNVGKRKFNYETLRSLASHPLIAAIIQTRVNQMAEFASLADEDGLGFRIYLADPNSSPNEEEVKEIRELEKFMLSCGTEQKNFEMSFENFMRQITRDSLVYDQCNFEIVRNKKGEIVSFTSVDAATIRRAGYSEREMSTGQRDPDGVHYVQVLDNKIVAEYNQKDLCFGVRRPRSDVGVMGYGFPELEEIYESLQNIFNAEAYNTANFTNGISTSGIIAVKSKMNPKLFRAFRREFYQMLTGVNNAKRTPLIQLDPDNDEQIQSVQLGSSNSEMEYQEWLHYLIKVICGVYQLDPAEIGFQFTVERIKNTLFTQDPFARVLLGREKGLRPLVRSVEVWINKYLMNQINPKYMFQFTGMDSISAIDKIKIEHHKMSYMTINEIRHYHDLPPLEDGDIIGIHYASLKATAINREGLEVGEQFGSGGQDITELPQEDTSTKPQLSDEQIAIARLKQDPKKKPKRQAANSAQADDNDKPDKPTSMGNTNDPSYLDNAIGKNIHHEMDEFFGEMNVELYKIYDDEELEYLKKKKVDYDKDGIEHPAQYFEGLDPETARKREKELERRKKLDKPDYSPLPGDDIDKAKKQNKGTKSKKAAAVREEIKKPGKKEFIRAASKVSGVSRSIIEEVYDKGLAAFASSGHRPGQTPQSWARARTYAFLFDSKSGARKADKELWARHLKKNEETEALEKSTDSYKPPQHVADEAKRAIDAREKHGDKVKGGTQIGWTRARQLANRENLSEETIRRMKAFFDRHEKNKEVKPEDKDFPWNDNGYTAWIIWGGNPGRAWAEMMVERFNKESKE